MVQGELHEIGQAEIARTVEVHNGYHGIELDMLLGSAAYRLRRAFSATGDRRQAFHVYEKTASTLVPQSADQVYPPNLMADPTSASDKYYIRPWQN